MLLQTIEYVFQLFELKLFFAIAKGFLLSNSKSLLSVFSPLLSNSKFLVSVFFPLLLQFFSVGVKGQKEGPQLRGAWNLEWKASPQGLPCLLKMSYLGFLIDKVQLYMNISIRCLVLEQSMNGELTNPFFFIYYIQYKWTYYIQTL